MEDRLLIKIQKDRAAYWDGDRYIHKAERERNAIKDDWGVVVSSVIWALSIIAMLVVPMLGFELAQAKIILICLLVVSISSAIYRAFKMHNQ